MGPTRKPLEERLWAKVNKTESCWLWMGSVAGRGYGRIRRPGHNGLEVYVHRLSWEMHFGSIPEGRQVLHRCAARLTASNVSDARRLRAAGATVSGLARQFAVSRRSMRDALNERTWRHVG